MTGEYIDAKRKEFVESMESKLDQLSKELDEMGKAAADKSDELRNDYREYHSSAKTKIEELRTQLGQAKDQGAEAWDAFTDQLSKAYEDVKSGLKAAQQKFTEDEGKTEPAGEQTETTGTE